MGVADMLYKGVQRGRERHFPPVVNESLARWPTPSPTPLSVVVEELEYYVEDGPQGWVPLRIVRPRETYDKMSMPLPPDGPPPPPPAVAESAFAKAVQAAEAAPPPPQTTEKADLSSASTDAASSSKGVAGLVIRRPLLIIMHATEESLDAVRPKQELYARMGYVTAAIDARYHGQRAAIPYEVAAAMQAAAPKVATAAEAAAAVNDGGGLSNPATLTASVKGLSPKALAALQRADAAMGLVTSPSLSNTAAELSAMTLLSATSTSPALTRTVTRMSAPVGSRTAAAEARDEASARERAAAHERFEQAWLGVVSEFRARRGQEPTIAVLATAPPKAAEGGSFSGGAAPSVVVVPAPCRGVVTADPHRGPAVSRMDKMTAVNVYELALAAAWRGSGEQPLFLDTVWDLVLLMDVLALRPEVDMTRVGVTGFSMGGTITWLLSLIDPRVTAVAPVSGVQGFTWALDNDSFHARVGRYPLVFEIAASDLQGTKTAEINSEVVTAVWNKLLPGLLSVYDAHLSLPTLVPLPLLVATGELDASCPLPGVQEAVDLTRDVYLKWAQKQRQLQLEAEADTAAAAAAAAAAAESRAVSAEAAAEEHRSVPGHEAASAVGSSPMGRDAVTLHNSHLGKEGGVPEKENAASVVVARALGVRGRGAARAATDPGGGLDHSESDDGGGEGTAGNVAICKRPSSAAAAVIAFAAGARAVAVTAKSSDGGLSDAMMEVCGQDAEAAALALLTSMAEEDAMETAAAAAAVEAAAARAAAAAAAAARAAALAYAAEQERQEEQAVEALLGSRFRFIAQPGVDHTETDLMRRAVQEWMHLHLMEPWIRERIATRAKEVAAATAGNV